MQGQGRSGIAVGQHQHREAADGDLGIAGGADPVTLQLAGVLDTGGRVKSDGAHRLLVKGVEKVQLMKADAPMRVGSGLHRNHAAEQADQ